MMLTEEQAKTKRCQESFGDSNVSPAGYAPFFTGASVAMQTSPSMCLGSGCMAWRWEWNIEGNRASTALRGYCGKAGKP